MTTRFSPGRSRPTRADVVQSVPPRRLRPTYAAARPVRPLSNPVGLWGDAQIGLEGLPTRREAVFGVVV